MMSRCRQVCGGAVSARGAVVGWCGGAAVRVLVGVAGVATMLRGNLDLGAGQIRIVAVEPPGESSRPSG